MSIPSTAPGWKYEIYLTNDLLRKKDLPFTERQFTTTPFFQGGCERATGMTDFIPRMRQVSAQAHSRG